MAKLNHAGQFKNLTGLRVQALLGKHDPGDLTILDVRQPWEYEEFRLPGARLLPLDQLPERLNELNQDKPILTYCRSGARSTAAASLLAGQGFAKVYNLLGGIMAWTKPGVAGSAQAGMNALTGDETPEELLAAAYGMEQGLADFYRGQAKTLDDPDLRATLAKLAGFEEKHKITVYKLYKAICPESPGPEELAAKAKTRAVEGGLDPALVLAEAGGLGSRHEVLELATAFEIQALDLYMRLARLAKAEASRKMLEALAKEENHHVKALGSLLKNAPRENTPDKS